MTKVYTKSGDDGSTSLFGGGRVSKAHPRVAAYGTLDELNAVIALAVSSCADEALRTRLVNLQRRLFDLGADIATPMDVPASQHVRRVPAEWASELEDEIDAMTEDLAPLTTFVLPGGSPSSAGLHLARTVCRRAERRLVEAIEAGEDLNPAVLAYINRLGDWLFTAARLANARAGVPDTEWHASG